MPTNPKLCMLTKSSMIECYWVALIAVSDFRFNIINSIWLHSSIVRRLVLLVGLKKQLGEYIQKSMRGSRWDPHCVIVMLKGYIHIRTCRTLSGAAVKARWRQEWTLRMLVKAKTICNSYLQSSTFIWKCRLNGESSIGPQ